MPYPSLFEYSPACAREFFKHAQADYEPGRGTAANEEPPDDPNDRQLPRLPHPALHALKAVGTGMLGFGGGVGLGRGAVELLNKATGGYMPPEPWERALPLIGGGAGLAYMAYKEHELQELRRALQSHQNRTQSTGREPVGREPA